MSANDELRRMLDERGVHWWESEDERKTLWESNGLTWEYFNDENGDAWLGFLGATEQDITPEQAIAAALGGVECEYVIEDNMNETDGMGDVWIRCTNCGITYDYYAGDWLMKQNYCPYCGCKIRKAVEHEQG